MSDSHKGFFEGKKLKASYVADDEPVPTTRSARNEKQAVRRVEKLSEVVQDALVHRVKDPGGDKVMRVTHDEFMRMKDDPEFQLFSQYMNLILCYGDGRPRDKPLRPFLEHELGMYRGKVVVLANNPGDGQLTGKIIQVTQQLGDGVLDGTLFDDGKPRVVSTVPILPEPDPFPSMRLIKDSDDDHCCDDH
jgi:hypothetical protein